VNSINVINDVIASYKKYPDDWKQTWLLVQKKWADDIGCPDGVFRPFNIDAKVNAAYVVIGLLYGKGDFTRTLEISTRCGQDADCNPSSAGGILGAVLGYSKIPAYWKMGLKEAESIDFKYTTMSLDDVYEVGLQHALQVIEKNGGKISGDQVSIKTQLPATVKFEKSFDGLYPVSKSAVKFSENKDEVNFEFEGTGFALRGETAIRNAPANHVYNTELYIDDKLVESPKLPANFTTRRHELCWNYNLSKGKHQVKLKILNPLKDYEFRVGEVIIYSDKPVNGISFNERAAAGK
jgi:hypothetical protein